MEKINEIFGSIFKKPKHVSWITADCSSEEEQQREKLFAFGDSLARYDSGDDNARVVNVWIEKKHGVFFYQFEVDYVSSNSERCHYFLRSAANRMYAEENM